VRLGRDRIEVDEAQVAAEARTYLMLNKPRGIITTASDEKSRDTVYSLLDENLPWVGPVGRLDKASEGLLLLTNDSEWAARIVDPNSHVDKTYHVQVTIADGETLAGKMGAGVVADGELLRAKSARFLRGGEKNAWLEIVLDQGKNRQIRRMAKALGAEVKHLVRVAIGPILLGDLAKGHSRALTAQEKKLLDLAVNLQRSEPKAHSLRNGR
jgi:23S rRNA pseudouridine2605 synthase